MKREATPFPCPGGALGDQLDRVRTKLLTYFMETTFVFVGFFSFD